MQPSSSVSGGVLALRTSVQAPCTSILGALCVRHHKWVTKTPSSIVVVPLVTSVVHGGSARGIGCQCAERCPRSVPLDSCEVPGSKVRTGHSTCVARERIGGSGLTVFDLLQKPEAQPTALHKRERCPRCPPDFFIHHGRRCEALINPVPLQHTHDRMGDWIPCLGFPCPPMLQKVSPPHSTDLKIMQHTAEPQECTVWCVPVPLCSDVSRPL